MELLVIFLLDYILKFLYLNIFFRHFYMTEIILLYFDMYAGPICLVLHGTNKILTTIILLFCSHFFELPSYAMMETQCPSNYNY